MPDRQPSARRRFRLAIRVAAVLLALAAGAGTFFVARAATFTDQASVPGNTFTTDTLAPPTGLTATVVGSNIRLDWTPTTDTYATGYNVLRGTISGGPYSQIGTATPYTATTYTDNTVAAGTRYYYVLQTFFQSWLSVYSNEANSAVPATVSFVSSADSYVAQDSVGSNYGTDTSMFVKSGGSQKRRSFVRFDISSVPANSMISSASLTLCATGVPAASRTYLISQVTANWNETGITWQNQPSVAASPTASATTPGSVGCMTWTVTSDVQAWVSGTANYGWRLSDQTEGGPASYTTTYRTREDISVPAEQPTLDFTYTPP